MSVRVAGSPLSSIVVVLLLSGMFFVGVTGSALPSVAPVSSVVHVGEVGVEDWVTAFSDPQDVVLVAPASRVTVQADWSFEAVFHPPGATYVYSVVMRLKSGEGVIGSVGHQVVVSQPQSLSEAGVLEFELGVPEVLRGVTVTLEASVSSHGPNGQALLDSAVGSAGLVAVAVPDPVVLLEEDLVAGDSFPVGEVSAMVGDVDVEASNGGVHVSSGLGTRFVADVVVERPVVPAATVYNFNVHVALTVNVEGGGSYNSGVMVFQEHCSDWSGHGCSATALTRERALEVVVPGLELAPGSAVTASLSVHYEWDWWNAQTDDQDHFWFHGGDAGRHWIVSV